jgi:ppGpp synthetase/RelA/SpoT-type nucleotidyltranferase
MIYPSILERRYLEYLPFVEQVANRVKDTIINFCEENGYASTYRIKTKESLAEKIETGRFKKWSDLDDLFGCTVIIPTLYKETNVIQFCKNTFEVVKTIKRGQNKKSPDTFRFDTTRIYARLKRPEDAIGNKQLNIFDITFEIQIKSAFEHAWTVSTHELVYKSSTIDWKRLRLAAQIKATVEQLDTLILAFEEAYPKIQGNDYPEIKRKCKLATETQKLFDQGKIPQELKPKDMTRFCDNVYRILSSAEKEKNMQDVITCIKQKINSTPSKQIPLSLSLLQYFIAILVENQVIKFPLPKYYFHVTDELITLYPKCFEKNANSTFQYHS